MITIMYLFENLQIGVLNAWIGPVIAWGNLLFLFMINPRAIRRLNDMSWYSKRDKMASTGTMVLMFAIMITTIWVPVLYGSICFYVGVSFFLLGVIMNLLALYNYGTTPINKPITKGMYRISRHPLYLCWTIMLIGICISTASWLLIILTILYHIPSHILILGEEKYCRKKYGRSYNRYTRNVPRYL